MTTHSENTAVETEATTREFTLWALNMLGLQVDSEDDQVFRFFAPEELRESLNGAGSVRFTFELPERESAGRASLMEQVTPDSRMFLWLVSQLDARSGPLEARPREDVANLEELAEVLRRAYDVPDGTLQLEGQLQPRPLLRLTCLITSGDRELPPRLSHWFFWRDGNHVDAEQVERLGLRELAPLIPGWRESLSSGGVLEDVSGWVESCHEAVRRYVVAGSPDDCVDLVAACVIWTNHVSGAICFQLGQGRARVELCGWATELASGRQSPPPYQCPVTKRESHHLQVTDDGQITVREALEVCGHSQRRVLPQQLETCPASGIRALPEFFVECPLTGRRILRSRFVQCEDCHERVDPEAVQRGRCRACRELSLVSKDDPRMARVLGEYPSLDRWGHWRLSETGTSYVLVATAWFRRLLVVVRKDTLEVAHLATSGRWSSRWMPVPPEQRLEFLQ